MRKDKKSPFANNEPELQKTLSKMNEQSKKMMESRTIEEFKKRKLEVQELNEELRQILEKCFCRPIKKTGSE